MTDELRDHLRNSIEDAIERDEDHLDWLAHHPNEPDREAQIEDTRRSLELTKRLRDVPVD
jgi:hypothetical protein